MKKIILLILCILLTDIIANGQMPKFRDFNYTEASSLTLVGKMFPNTANPYHLIDTTQFKGFTEIENQQVRFSAGLAVAFKTNSRYLLVYTDYQLAAIDLTDGTGTMGRGYSVYIKKDGRWIFMGAEKLNMDQLSDTMLIGSEMDRNEKECLIYFPLLSEENSIQIGTEKESYIQALDNPFRHRIAVFGSSYTHGTSSARPGMSYVEQFARHTGLQTVSVGVGGNAKMQPYFTEVLCHAEADAFLFDVFSNPSATVIKERLFPFIERLQAAHPGKPLIFQQTIRRENRNFNLESDAVEQAKMAAADSMMAIALKKYKDVYYIHPNATSKDHESVVDGIHPDNYGYYLWSKSIEKPVLKILKRYGIK